MFLIKSNLLVMPSKPMTTGSTRGINATDQFAKNAARIFLMQIALHPLFKRSISFFVPTLFLLQDRHHLNNESR